MPDNATPQRKKIAILGGGLGSMTTALALTDPDHNPDWQEHYDITVYQVGWRLGGKGSSGRGAYGRIEEHGLHIWMGFYENAFRAIQKVYKELNRPPDAALATWEQAFKKHSYLLVAEQINGAWKNWAFDFPENDGVPGEGGELPTVWEYIQMVIGWLASFYQGSSLAKKAKSPTADHEHSVLGWLETVARDIAIPLESRGLTLGAKLLHSADTLVKRLDPDPKNHHPDDYGTLLKFFEAFMHWLGKELEHEIETNDELRRLFILMDLGSTIVRGLIKDGVLSHPDGLDAIDHYDFMEWLQKHGASDISYDITKSALIRGLYDLVFAYRNGELSQPSFAAGVALRSVLRIVFTYKGAVFWKMQAGMGDTIFAPMYQVLKNRGVKFKFFHRVEHLGVSQDTNGKHAISAIHLGRQVTIRDQKEYLPLTPVKNLPCWPAEPLYDQIVEAEQLQAGKMNLESFWTPWEDVEKIVLQAGEDFHLVVLGIAVGGLPYICSELNVNPKWEQLTRKVETVRTLAMQLWLTPDLKGLGWEEKSPVLDAYVEPQNTWADMSHLIDREDWPTGYEPKNIAYFCGPMVGGIPPQEDHTFPDEAYKEVKEISRNWLNKNIGFLWPKALSQEHPPEFNCSQLVDPQATQDEGRFNDQFFRADIDPSDRYVLSVAGSTEYRLKSDESGFTNLYLTGDWIYNGFNVGCVEASVMSGLLASNAMYGYPKLEDIVGYTAP